MAWEDRTSFEAIHTQFGLSPGDVIRLMRSKMTTMYWRWKWPSKVQRLANGFIRWRAVPSACKAYGSIRPVTSVRSFAALWPLITKRCCWNRTVASIVCLAGFACVGFWNTGPASAQVLHAVVVGDNAPFFWGGYGKCTSAVVMDLTMLPDAVQ